MKIALFSNFLNHHQLPLCEAFCEAEGVEFVFVACEKISDDRLKMGYCDMNTAYPFVVRAYEDGAAALEIATSYDVVIFGASPVEYLSARMEKGLLSFNFAERSLKKGTWRRFIPTTRKKIFDRYTRYNNAPLYVLCASAYTSYDVSLCGFNPDKCFAWGYFPNVIGEDVDDLISKKRENKTTEILYAGRLLKLKRVMDTVKAAHKLLKKGMDLHFTIIGEGETEGSIRAYIERHSLEGMITLLPFMSPEGVREYMEKSDVYVFGSNFYEGWGAVVNEAMSSACVSVVSHAVGSAPYLIDNGRNGIIYPCADVNSLASSIESVLANRGLREEMGTNAYFTLKQTWNADVAVSRFITLCDTIRSGEDYRGLYESGPCSVAKVYKNSWFKADTKKLKDKKY